MSIRDILGKKIIVFDGAIGTALQAVGLEGGEITETFNFNNPQVVKDMYKDYLNAGSNVITTNTFSSNSIKLKNEKFSDEESITKATGIAKEAINEFGKDAFVAHSIGPSGQLMKPLGDLDFDTAYELYKRQIVAGKDAGADLHLFETFSDIFELKVGLIAAKENSNLPIFCSVTFDDDGRMLLGTDPETAVYILQDMGIDAIGINCSLGPKEVVPLVKRMLHVSKIPVFVQPNAGMPREEEGVTHYDVTPQIFTEYAWDMLKAGIAAIGGCCGTTKEFISSVSNKIEGAKDEYLPGLDEGFYEEKRNKSNPSACTTNKAVVLGKDTIIIGERINPTGKDFLKEALKSKDYTVFESEAIAQENAGCHIINVNVGMGGIDEVEAMNEVTGRVSKVAGVPLQIDSSNADAIELAVRKYSGKPIINSVNGEKASMDKIFPIVKKYGTAVIALTLDENGIPKTKEDRLTILEKIINEASKYGITKDRIIADTLALTVSTDPLSAKNTLKAIETIEKEYNIKTVLGASNISFGLPSRRLINRAFLAMAVYSGISSIITDPTCNEYMDEIYASQVLSGRDEFAKNYICYNEGVSDFYQNKSEDKMTLKQSILGGYAEKASDAASELLKTKEPLKIIDEIIVPSLNVIGEDYEAGKTFLPQMIKSAEAVKATFDVLKPVISQKGQSISKGKMILATVKGDIHDIGKNIVKTVLENYGYEIVDLGKDVDAETIIETIKKENIGFVGLSALMTTTMVNMKIVIERILEEGINCKVAVGGAVLTQEYADRIKADFYCKTAMDTVRAADKTFIAR